MHTTTPHVPLLRTPMQVADWLDASHPYAVNGAAFDRIEAHLGGTVEAMQLWRAGVRLTLPESQTAVCPACGRLVAIRNGQYEAHTDPRGYDRPCHQGGQ